MSRKTISWSHLLPERCESDYGKNTADSSYIRQEAYQKLADIKAREEQRKQKDKDEKEYNSYHILAKRLKRTNSLNY